MAARSTRRRLQRAAVLACLALGCDPIPDLYVIDASPDAASADDADVAHDAGNAGDAGTAGDAGDAGDAYAAACQGVSCPDCPPNPGACCANDVPCYGDNCVAECPSCAMCPGGFCCAKQGGMPVCHGNDAGKCP